MTVHRTHRTSRNAPLRALLLCALAGAATITGCASGHGKYTSEGLEQAQTRLGAIKAGADWEMARQQFLSGDLEKALNTVGRAIANAETVAKSHTLRGRILLEMGDLVEARESFERAISLDPNTPDPQYYRGIVFERLSRYEDALAQYQKAAVLDPGEPQYTVASAEMLIELGDLAGADALLRNNLERFDGSAGVRQTLGHISLMRGDSQGAVQLFREARMLAPDDRSVLGDLARALVAERQWAEAELVLSTITSSDSAKDKSHRDLLHLRARCLMRLDRLVDARSVLLTLTSHEEGPADRDAWLALGRVALQLNDLPRLRSAGSRLVALMPDDSAGHMLIAAWKRRRGDIEGALASLDRATDLTPGDPDPWMLRSVVLRELGDERGAAESLRTAQLLQMNGKPVRSTIANATERE